MSSNLGDDANELMVSPAHQHINVAERASEQMTREEKREARISNWIYRYILAMFTINLIMTSFSGYGLYYCFGAPGIDYDPSDTSFVFDTFTFMAILYAARYLFVTLFILLMLLKRECMQHQMHLLTFPALLMRYIAIFLRGLAVIFLIPVVTIFTTVESDFQRSFLVVMWLLISDSTITLLEVSVLLVLVFRYGKPFLYSVAPSANAFMHMSWYVPDYFLPDDATYRSRGRITREIVNLLTARPLGTTRHTHTLELVRHSDRRHIIDNLPNFAYQPDMFNPGDRACSICMSEFVKDECITSLLCVHHFHKACIDDWLTRRSLDCPLCKHTQTKVSDEDAYEPERSSSIA